MFCALFGLSKQAYYKGLSQSRLNEQEALRLRQSVLAALRQLMPRLGTRKLHYLLCKNPETGIGRDRLFSFLRREGLLVGRKRRYTVTTNSKHWLRKYPNLAKGMELVRPEQLWVADITYLDMIEGHAYLHLVTDAYSKRIMGYELCGDMRAESTLKALRMALGNRKYNLPLTHHSDRGLQYCSGIYTERLIKDGITISMTENGDPYENAIAERVNGILKDEFGLSDKFEDLEIARKTVHQSIDIYNDLRPHHTCQMLTPKQMHRQDQISLISYKRKKPKHLLDV
jgi:putative transposase